MGTDIHPIVQRKVNGTWENVPLPLDGYEGRWNESIGGRNYFIFALLAGVRNGHGFAGIPTHQPITPISEPRGLPDDFDATVQDHSEEECEDKEWCDHTPWLGEHSFSWVSLVELEAVNWDQVLMRVGQVEEAIYLKWVEKGRVGDPETWCGEASGPGIIAVSEYDYISGLYQKRPGDRPEIKCAWAVPYKKAAEGLYTKGLPWLRTLGNSDDVRIVFGFDS